MNALLQTHVGGGQAIAMAERAHGYVMRRPFAHAFKGEQALDRGTGLHRAQGLKIQLALRHGARDADDVARLGSGNLKAAKLVRRGGGEDLGSGKQWIPAAFKLYNAPVALNQRTLHLVGERKIYLLLKDGGDQRFVRVCNLWNPHPAEVNRKPCEHGIRSPKTIKRRQVEVQCQLPPDESGGCPESPAVAPAAQNTNPQSGARSGWALRNSIEDGLSFNLGGAPVFVLVEVVEQRLEAASVGKGRRAEDETQSPAKIERLNGAENHSYLCPLVSEGSGSALHEETLSGASIRVTRRAPVHPYKRGMWDRVRNLEQGVNMHYTSEVFARLGRGAGDYIFSRGLMQVPQEALEKTEGALVTEAKAGSAEAFEDLVNRYERKIYRLALRLTGNPQDAEDVLQETFLKAFEHLPDFRQDSRFYTWLVRIAVNEGLMKLRKRRSDKSEPMEDGVDDEGQVMPREFRDWKPNPEQLMSQEEMETLLLNAANGLPEGLRTVFFLRDVEELSTEETAEALNLTAGAVKARLFRARMRLREELAKVLKRK